MIGQGVRILIALLVLGPVFAPASAEAPARYGYRIVAAYPHDAAAFTQGLVFHGGFLYESTGRFGASSVRKVELETGRVVNIRELPENRFGEGLTVVGDRLVQLTWRSRTGYLYDLENLEPAGQFHYPTEGWGLAYDGERLLLSDGSATIYLMDPETFGLTGRIAVHDRGRSVSRLNELEFVNGFIYANVWLSTRIAKIDPRSGRVAGWIELAGLVPPASSGADVLNGIAYERNSGTFLVTGKLWPRLFMINIVAQ
ncbi:MAG TPA: glutaminyl-peptide cyclotransferase [Gammaproteobacteria bacterium]